MLRDSLTRSTPVFSWLAFDGVAQSAARRRGRCNHCSTSPGWALVGNCTLISPSLGSGVGVGSSADRREVRDIVG